MRGDFWWIRVIDHRISTALIFSALLILLGNGRERRCSLLGWAYAAQACAWPAGAFAPGRRSSFWGRYPRDLAMPYTSF